MNEEKQVESVSIEASLTASGVSLNAKSRFISAIDRLFGGIVSIPATHLEEHAAKTRLLAELDREKLRQKAELQLTGELKLEQLRMAAEYVARERETKRLLNLAAVAQLALEDLRESASETKASDENVAGEISEDWLNWFESYAEKATSEDIRRLWGKILAGESRNPGSFSLSTLRVVSETDHQLAELFQRHVCDVFETRYLFKTEESAKGLELLELSTLEDAGCLREVSGILSLNWKFDEAGKFVHRTGNLVFIAEGPASFTFQIGVILVARAAVDLLAILPSVAQDRAYRKLATLMPTSTTSIKLGIVVAEPIPGQISWIESEILKEPAPETAD